MVTDREFLELSSRVYSTNVKKQTINIESDKSGGRSYWKVLDVSNASVRTGYYGVVYQNTATNEVVIANRGTDKAELVDWWEDPIYSIGTLLR